MTATYRIAIRHDPHSENLPWEALIYRISDGALVATCYSGTPADAERDARQWIRDEQLKREGVSIYVDDDGEDAPYLGVA